MFPDKDNMDEHSITTLPPSAVEAGAQDIPVSSKIALSKRNTDILQVASPVATTNRCSCSETRGCLLSHFDLMRDFDLMREFDGVVSIF